MVVKMELKIYLNMDAYLKHKAMLCKRVSDPDSFDLQSVRKVLRCLYGENVYVEVLFVC